MDENEEYLAHYGVLGMKWGIRRARNILSKLPKRQRKKEKYDYKATKYELKKDTATSAGREKKYTKKYRKNKYKVNKEAKKINKGKNYVVKVNKKISKISEEDLNNGYEFCKEFTQEFRDYKDVNF